MIETISILFALVWGIACWYYAHRAHRNSVRAPILKLSFCHPDTKERLPLPNDPSEPITIGFSQADYANRLKEVRGEEVLCFQLPFVVDNIGTRTAKNIKVRVRYGAVFNILTTVPAIHDADSPHWTVVEHAIPDIHPKEPHTFAGDNLSPAPEFVFGALIKTPVTFRDGEKTDVTVAVGLSGFIELIAFCEDCEPTYRLAEMVFVEDLDEAELHRLREAQYRKRKQQLDDCIPHREADSG